MRPRRDGIWVGLATLLATLCVFPISVVSGVSAPTSRLGHSEEADVESHAKRRRRMTPYATSLALAALLAVLCVVALSGTSVLASLVGFQPARYSGSPWPVSDFPSSGLWGQPAIECYAPSGLNGSTPNTAATVGTPECFDVSFSHSDSGTEFVGGEVFPITVQGIPSTVVQLSLTTKSDSVAAWLSSSSIQLDAAGYGNTTLYISGAYVSSSVATPNTVPLNLAFADSAGTEGVIAIPMVENVPVFTAGSGSEPSIPNLSPTAGTSDTYWNVWGIAYLPPSGTSGNLSVSLSVAGVRSGDTLTALPSWMKVWFTDQSMPNAAYSPGPFSASVQPTHVHYFMTNVQIGDAPSGTSGSYTIEVNLVVNGVTYPATFTVTISPPIRL